MIQFSLLQDADPVVEKLFVSTEEGQKVTRNQGDKFPAVFRRIEDSDSAADKAQIADS